MVLDSLEEYRNKLTFLNSFREQTKFFPIHPEAPKTTIFFVKEFKSVIDSIIIYI